MNKEILQYFAAYISREIGIQYQDADLYQLETRLQSFIRLKGHASVEVLHGLFASGRVPPREAKEFLELATNNETSFFRDASLFRALREELLPLLRGEVSPGSTLRIWSAASSTGQEAYSVAMTIEEFGQLQSLDYIIACTDFNEAVLNRAREGIYNALEVGRGLTPELLSRYFVKEAGGQGAMGESWRVSSKLRSRMTFTQANLLEPFPSGEPYQLVFLRNMLIYQGVPNRREIIGRVKDKMASGGYLVLGATENLIGIDEGAFTQLTLGGAVFYRKN